MPSRLIEDLRAALAREAIPALTGDLDLGAEAMGQLVPAAVLVAVTARREPGLILTTRVAGLRKHGGQVAFPGGRVDAEDSGPVAAALREAEEEIGLPPPLVEVLGQSDDYRTGTGYRVHPVVGLVPPDLALTPNPAEVADLFEVPLAHVLDPANHEERTAEWNGATRRYFAISWQQRLIWGATAGMLVTLSRRLHGHG